MPTDDTGAGGFQTFNSLSFDPDLGPNLNNFDPVALLRATQRTSLNSQRYIARFTAADTAPIAVIDDGGVSQGLRDAQIVKLARSIFGQEVQKATDIQVLNMHRTALMGWF